MEGSIGSSLCRGVRSCLARRRICSNTYHRLRAPPAPGRGVRLSRRTVLGAAAWRFAGLRRRACVRWSPLQLLSRVLDTYIGSMLSAPAARPPSPPRLLRRDGSPASRSRRRDAAGGGRGVVLNICVAEVLLRRTTSEVRRSPLQQPRNAMRCRSVRS